MVPQHQDIEAAKSLKGVTTSTPTGRSRTEGPCRCRGRATISRRYGGPFPITAPARKQGPEISTERAAYGTGAPDRSLRPRSAPARWNPPWRDLSPPAVGRGPRPCSWTKKTVRHLKTHMSCVNLSLTEATFWSSRSRRQTLDAGVTKPLRRETLGIGHASLKQHHGLGESPWMSGAVARAALYRSSPARRPRLMWTVVRVQLPRDRNDSR